MSVSSRQRTRGKRTKERNPAAATPALVLLGATAASGLLAALLWPCRARAQAPKPCTTDPIVWSEARARELIRGELDKGVDDPSWYHPRRLRMSTKPTSISRPIARDLPGTSRRRTGLVGLPSEGCRHGMGGQGGQGRRDGVVRREQSRQLARAPQHDREMLREGSQRKGVGRWLADLVAANVDIDPRSCADDLSIV